MPSKYFYGIKEYNQKHKKTFDIKDTNCVSYIAINKRIFIPLINEQGKPDLTCSIRAIQNDFCSLLDKDDLYKIFGMNIKVNIHSFKLEHDVKSYLRSDLIALLESHYYST